MTAPFDKPLPPFLAQRYGAPVAEPSPARESGEPLVLVVSELGMVADSVALLLRNQRATLDVRSARGVVPPGRSPAVVVCVANTVFEDARREIVACRERWPSAAVVGIVSIHSVQEVMALATLGLRGVLSPEDPVPTIVRAIEDAIHGRKFVSPVIGALLAAELAGDESSSATERAPRPALSPREEQLLRLICAGHTDRQSADQLGISLNTVRTHRQSLMKKLGANRAAQLVRAAIDQRLLEAPGSPDGSRAPARHVARPRARPAPADERLRRWFEDAPDPIHVTSTEGRFLFANPAWHAVLGYDAAEAVGLDLFAVVAPESHGDCRELFAGLAGEGRAATRELALVTRAGERIDVSVRASLMREAGEPDAVLGIYRVGGAGRGRGSRDGEERFFRLAEVAQDAIAEFDEHGRCLYASERHRDLLGIEPRALTDRRLAELVHPEEVGTALESFRAADASGRPTRSLLRFRHADGSYRWFEATVSWFTTSYGERRMFSASRDVSERVRRDEEVRRSEARYRAILENSLDMIAIIGEGGTITFQDAVAGGVLGWSLDEIQSTAAVDFVHPDDRERASAAIQECISAPREVVTVDLRVRHCDGSWRWVSASGRNLMGVEGVDGIMVTARDVTEQRELAAALELREAELRQAQKMEALGRLAGGVAHDFNNLLSVITCYADLLLHEGDEPSATEEAAAAIRDAATRAAGLTRQLLAFSRKQTFAPRLLDLSAAVRDVAKMLTRVIGEDVALVLDLAERLPPVLLDPTQLDQVLLNLAVNARDAMPEGGVLTLATRASLTAPRRVLLSVGDTGLGMDADIQAHVFEPFFTTKPSEKGTGLGLSMVYGVVTQSGGTISIDSAPGKGARFLLDFPAAASESKREGDGRDAGRVEVASGGTILVIEDDSTVRVLVQRLLEGRGYRVLSAATRHEATELCARTTSPPELVLSDVILPDGSGSGLVAEIRNRWPAVPSLLMSGYLGDMLDARGLEGCADGFLEKPFTPDSLMKAIDEVLARRAGSR